MREDWLNNGLPTYTGDKDRSTARAAIDHLGGPSGFKTAYRTNADGSVTRIQLKGDMPPEITTIYDDKTEEPSQPITPRGYVTHPYIGSVMSAVTATIDFILQLKVVHVVRGWFKIAKLSKTNPTTYGPYAVSNLKTVGSLADEAKSPTLYPDVWVLVGKKLYIYLANKLRIKSLSNQIISGIPLIFRVPPADPYGADYKIYLLTGQKIQFVSGNPDPNDPAEPQDVFDIDSINPGNAALARWATAGATYHIESYRVGFNRLLTYQGGNMRQVAKCLYLTGKWPHFTEFRTADSTIQGRIWLEPQGEMSTSTKPGAWDEPIEVKTTHCFTAYHRTLGGWVLWDRVGNGNPADFTPRFNTATWSSAYKIDGPLEASSESSTTVYDFPGQSSIVATYPIGFYGPTDLSVSIDIHADQTVHRTDGAGTLRVTSPIASYPMGYLPISSNGVPTTFPFPRQYQTYQGQQPWPPGMSEIGYPWVTACSGVSTSTTWTAPTTMKSTINSAAGGVDLLNISVTLNGKDKSWTGGRALPDETTPSVGQTVSVDSWSISNDIDIGNIALYEHIYTIDQCYPVRTNSPDFWEVTTGEESTGRNYTLTGTSRDYILFDETNKVYAYLEGFISGSGKLEATSGSSFISLTFVLEVNGHRREKLLHSASDGSLLIYWEYSKVGVPFHPPHMPFGGFAPMYCVQGECPFIAYAEKEDFDEQAGALLFNMPLRIKLSEEDECNDAPGAFIFTPGYFASLLGYANISQGIHWINAFKGPAIPVRFSNLKDQDGYWANDPYPDFAGDNQFHMEIYRV